MLTEASGQRVPLSDHVLFQSNDLDCARERVAQKFCNHRLDIIGDKKPFCVRHNHVAGEMISLNFISYGADVLIDPGELGDFYLIQMPISGAATIRNGSREFLTDRGTASVLNADWATKMKWWEGCAQLLIQVRKAPLHAFAMHLLDREIPSSLIFDPRIDFTRPEILAWRRLAHSMFQAAESKARMPVSGIQGVLHEQRLLELFLRNQPNNMSLFFNDQKPGATPRHVKRAEEFIRANVALPIGLHEISKAAGVAPRTLQLAYRNAFGITPIRALARERMRRARFDLVAGEASVTDVALKWGFNHFGRFAAEYRNEFGELPRETRKLQMARQ